MTSTRCVNGRDRGDRTAARNRSPEDINAIRIALQSMIMLEISRVWLGGRPGFRRVGARVEDGAFSATVMGVRTALSATIDTRNFNIDEAIAQHQLIVEAIVARDEEAARQKADEHMEWIAGTRLSEDSRIEDNTRKGGCASSIWIACGGNGGRAGIVRAGSRRRADYFVRIPAVIRQHVVINRRPATSESGRKTLRRRDGGRLWAGRAGSLARDIRRVAPVGST